MKNALLTQLINELNTQEAPVYKRVAKELKKPTRARVSVNITKLEKYAKDGETMLVPGKVLGTGMATKKLNVVAYEWSQAALDRIKSAGGSIISIADSVKKNKKGAGIRLIK